MNPLWREFERPQERKRSPAAPTTRPKALEDVYPQHSEHEMAAL